MSTVSKQKCVQGGCKYGTGPWCKTCAQNPKELQRRKDIPLTLGKDGLLRKYLGITVPSEEDERNG